MEITFGGTLQGHGRLAAFKGMGTSTYVAIARPDGVFQGEGQGMVMADQGDGFTVSGLGLGRLSGGKFTYRGALTFRSASPNLGWLNSVFGIFEFEQDMKTQKVVLTCYEWK